MTIELRKIFESELKDVLKNRFSGCKGMRVSKNEITVKLNGGEGRIGFRFLNNAQGYTLSESVVQPELRAYYNEVSSPYRPNFTTEFELVMNTSMETGFKSFSPNLGGTVDLPKNEDERLKACEWVYQKVKDIYLPRVINLMDLNSKVIDDVLLFPDYYAYPFLTVLYVIKKNKIHSSQLNMELIFSKKIVGSKSFDKELFNSYVNSLGV